MKIRYEKKEEQAKLVKDIAIGTVFSGAIGNYKGVFAKTYDRIVSLENMLHTWFLPLDEPIGRSDGFSKIKHIDNYKELDVDLVING